MSIEDIQYELAYEAHLESRAKRLGLAGFHPEELLDALEGSVDTRPLVEVVVDGERLSLDDLVGAYSGLVEAQEEVERLKAENRRVYAENDRLVMELRWRDTMIDGSLTLPDERDEWDDFDLSAN